nr:HepT-like ribonuclease domain-containing protein [Alicyclobacillus mali (ex Roth et al. 2021)]
MTKDHKQQIEVWLDALGARVAWLEDLAEREEAWEEDLTWRLAAERALWTSVEYVTDIASLIIDALVMRDPGGYADIVKVLVEEQVLDRPWFEAFTGAIDFRSRLLRDHARIAPKDVREAVSRYADLFAPFMNQIREFMRNN